MTFSPSSWGENYYENELGERNLEAYSERYSPLVNLNSYHGRLTFKDNDFFEFYLNDYLFDQEKELQFFFKSELASNLSCSDEQLNRHASDIRFAYRLVTMSYLIEALEHMRQMESVLNISSTCSQSIQEFISDCRPKTEDMKKYLSNLKSNFPRHISEIPRGFDFDQWKEGLKGEKIQFYSQHSLKKNCLNNCDKKIVENQFKKICDSNISLFKNICSEKDEIYGLSNHREAFYLLSRSQIINTFNQDEEAISCLKRYSQVNSYREIKYPALNKLFLEIQDFLRANYKERFLQGRSFILGSLKEFEQKGLADLVVDSKKFNVTPLKEEFEEKVEVSKNNSKLENDLKVDTKKIFVTHAEPRIKIEKNEVDEIQKSSFLLAAEVRKSQSLRSVEVDMLKFKYDYVFNLNTLNKLSKRLKVFMTRDALEEMVKFDSLGSIKGPVPLLFLKYMIDMQEHQGLWNLTSILGDSFYVSNEIDASLKPGVERIKILNTPQVEGHWQIYVISP